MRNYREVYRLMWRTYGAQASYWVSWGLQLIQRLAKIVLMPMAIAYMISALSSGDYSQAMFCALLYASGSLIIGVMKPLIRYVGMKGEHKAFEQMTSMYFNVLIKTDIEYFNSNMSGYLTASTRELSISSIELARLWRDAWLQDILGILLPIIIITWNDPLIGLAMIVAQAIQITYVFWLSKKVAPYRTEAREAMRHSAGIISDAISNVLAIRSSAQERAAMKRVEAQARVETTAFEKRVVTEVKLVFGRELLTVAFFALVFVLIVLHAQSGAISLAVALLIAQYAMTVEVGVYNLSEDIKTHDDKIDKILPACELLARENKIKDSAQAKKIVNPRGEIELENVSFAYDEAEVLKGFSLKIAHGEKIGVVGKSGAGKSTLAKLILRFDDVDDGSIKIDGHDVRDVTQESLHKNIAYVPQEPLLLHSTILENLRLSKPNATEKEVEKALRRAHAWDFVQELPKKLESVVGERGVKLSGGQKQRIVIARALLQESPIMILDEATSALDSESEQIIKDSFKDVLKGKTALVIAHRKTTLEYMDRIIEIRNGRLYESKV